MAHLRFPLNGTGAYRRTGGSGTHENGMGDRAMTDNRVNRAVTKVRAAASALCAWRAPDQGTAKKPRRSPRICRFAPSCAPPIWCASIPLTGAAGRAVDSGCSGCGRCEQDCSTDHGYSSGTHLGRSFRFPQEATSECRFRSIALEAAAWRAWLVSAAATCCLNFAGGGGITG